VSSPSSPTAPATAAVGERAPGFERRAPNLLRRLTLVWSTLFFGWFTLQAIVHEIWPALVG
jgi:hypothetical protein